MKKIVKINEQELRNIINESVKGVLNEISYDDWKLMTPEEDAGLELCEVEITLRVYCDYEDLRFWDDCEKSDVKQDEDGVEFTTTFRDEIWVGRHADYYDLETSCKDCAREYAFSICGNYEMLDFRIV